MDLENFGDSRSSLTYNFQYLTGRFCVFYVTTILVLEFYSRKGLTFTREFSKGPIELWAMPTRILCKEGSSSKNSCQSFKSCFYLSGKTYDVVRVGWLYPGAEAKLFCDSQGFLLELVGTSTVLGPKYRQALLVLFVKVILSWFT